MILKKRSEKPKEEKDKEKDNENPKDVNIKIDKKEINEEKEKIILDKIRNLIEEDLKEVGVVEQMPKMEGRQMVTVFAPKKK